MNEIESALRAILYTEHIRDWLKLQDPKLLEQGDKALGKTGAWFPEGARNGELNTR